MQCANEELKTTFELPDAPTKREMLRYEEQIERFAGQTSGPGMYERLWNAACTVVKDWRSESVPEAAPEALDGAYTPESAQVIQWAGLMAFSWYRQVKEGALPKNS